MTRGAPRHEAAFATVLTAFIAAGFSVYSVGRSDWNTALWSACVAIAIPAWLFAVRAPTTCGVVTRSGRACQNMTYGVLFGCGSAYGHTWTKFFARLGWHRTPATTARRRPRGGTPPVADVENDESAIVRIEEDTKSRVTFLLAITATFAGCISAATDLAGIFTN